MGGMSGGGMGFIFDPATKEEAKIWLQKSLIDLKTEMQSSLPFAMNPVVYDFKINEKGTYATLKKEASTLMPTEYYKLILPNLLKQELENLTSLQQKELEHIALYKQDNISYQKLLAGLFSRMLPDVQKNKGKTITIHTLLQNLGFDQNLHSEIQTNLKAGKIGLSKNRLPAETKIDDTEAINMSQLSKEEITECTLIGEQALINEELAIISLAGGVGSRWTKGSGVVKSLHPFIKFNGMHKNFIDIHLSKNEKIAKKLRTRIPHVFSTSYLTHNAISTYINTNYPQNVYLSEGEFIGLRLYPTERDLKFYWEELPQQILDDQAQKMKDSLKNAIVNWAKLNGEGEDYTENIPQQCIHPVGHWFELPNFLINGTLHKLLQKHPKLSYILLHNIDTMGVSPDPTLLGYHIKKENTFTIEVISRWVHDRGGGLAKINGKDQLVEGLSLPNEEIEFDLSYYNSGSFWININNLLKLFNIERDELDNKDVVKRKILDIARQMPSYITLKDVKRRWGKGQEDIFPITQFEKLWGDMTAMNNISTEFIEVDRLRGQQLKDVSQLDGWLRDGSADYVNNLCSW